MKDKIDIDQADLCCQIYDLIDKGEAGKAVVLLRQYIAKELPKERKELAEFESVDYWGKDVVKQMNWAYNLAVKDIKHKLGVQGDKE